MTIGNTIKLTAKNGKVFKAKDADGAAFGLLPNTKIVVLGAELDIGETATPVPDGDITAVVTRITYFERLNGGRTNYLPYASTDDYYSCSLVQDLLEQRLNVADTFAKAGQPELVDAFIALDDATDPERSYYLRCSEVNVTPPVNLVLRLLGINATYSTASIACRALKDEAQPEFTIAKSGLNPDTNLDKIKQFFINQNPVIRDVFGTMIIHGYAADVCALAAEASHAGFAICVLDR